MIQRLQNKATAWMITAVLIVLSVLLGGRMSLTSLQNRASDVFYSGSGSQYQSILYALDEVCAMSDNLLTLGGQYLPENDIMLQDVRKSKEMLEQSYSPKDRYLAAEKLRVAVEDLDGVLAKQALTDADQTYQSKMMADIRAQYSEIASNAYNEQAGTFNAQLQQFPASLIAAVTGVEPLELYAP